MATLLGKELRKLRTDRDWLLKDMADGIGVTPSFLSAVETGRKRAPADLIDRIARWGGLDDEIVQKLQRAMDRSTEEVSIRTSGFSSEDKEAMAVLARTFGEMSEEKKAQLRQLVFRERKRDV